MTETTRQSPLDYDRFLNDMCYDKKDLAIRLITILVNERGPQLISDLSDAVDKNDDKSIRSICHTLKGTAANMYAYSLSEKAFEFNQIAKKGARQKYGGMLADIKKVFNDIVPWWQTKKNELI